MSDHLVRMFKALGHPNRFRLFSEIRDAGHQELEAEGGCFLHSLLARLDVGAPTVSHHLKELVNAGLVRTERRGKFVTCSVVPDALAQLRTFCAPTQANIPDSKGACS